MSGKLTSEKFAEMLFNDSLYSIFGDSKQEFIGNASVEDINDLLADNQMGSRMVQESLRTYLMSFTADSESEPALDERVKKYSVVEVYPVPTLEALRKRFSNYLNMPSEEQEKLVGGLLAQ